MRAMGEYFAQNGLGADPVSTLPAMPGYYQTSWPIHGTDWAIGVAVGLGLGYVYFKRK